MSPMLIVGVLLLVGFLFGEVAQRFRLPKIIGYIIAGVLLNPQLCHFIPANLPDKTNGVENLALSFITFSIGGSLYYKELKKLGKGILCITFFEAEVAFLAIMAGFLVSLPFLAHNVPSSQWFTYFIPISLLLACLGAPTDPSVAMAVNLEYRPKGEVSSTMLSVAALDDVLGIMNYSIAVVVAQTVISHAKFSGHTAFITPMAIIAGSILLGVVFGLAFNTVTNWLRKESEGVLIVIILSSLTICYGTATLIKVDELLALMAMGAVVANFNQMRERVFQVLERYLDELIFLVFFTISGMHINFAGIPKALPAIILFTIFRIIGKYGGTAFGASLAGSSLRVKKYTAGGLIPQGGIVIGLALIIQQNPAFKEFGNILLNVVVGTVIINEVLGTILTKRSLKSAGEIS